MTTTRTIAIGLFLLLLGAFGLTYVSLHKDTTSPLPLAALPASANPTAAVPTAPAEPTAAPVSTSPVARLTIPAIGVDANVISLGVDPDGTMQSPDNPRDVGWYTFAAHPGYAGNVVMAGHVDYHDYGPAVFWHLHELKAGDSIYIDLQDGTRFAYSVASLTAYEDSSAPVAQIVGPSDVEEVTLITCTGAFDTTAHNYNQRLVVVADRVDSTALRQDQAPGAPRTNNLN
ncbi:MAG TPA: class F sortase [Dehalococcoidia bacterium]|nr:class F sortase [Dehalococcoidia bacterium]